MGGLHQDGLKLDVIGLRQVVQQAFYQTFMLPGWLFGGLGGRAMDDADIKNMVVRKEIRAKNGGVLVVLPELDFDGF